MIFRILQDMCFLYRANYFYDDKYKLICWLFDKIPSCETVESSNDIPIPFSTSSETKPCVKSLKRSDHLI